MPTYLDLFRPGRASLSLALLTAITLVALDVLIVGTVLPTLLENFGGISLYAWALGAYNLGNFATIPIFSVLTGKWGGRGAFSLALGIFLLGALVGTIASSMEMIVVARLLQGLGAGGFFAIPFALIARFYPSDLQPRAVGLVSSVWGVSALLGPIAGAIILKYLGWRWVFAFNLPVGIGIWLLALFSLRGEGKPPEPKAQVNWVGPLLFAVWTALFLEALAHRFPFNLVLLLSGGLSFFVFWQYEGRQVNPTIPREVWSPKKPLGVAFLAMALSAIAFGGAETYLPLLLQGLYQKSPLEAGAILTVGSIGWSFTSVIIAKYANHPRSLAVWGSMLLALGLLGLVGIFALHNFMFGIYIFWFISGIGMGMVVPTYNTRAIDLKNRFPDGVATGSVLLGMTWGFALGAPLAGVAAGWGFGKHFNPQGLSQGLLPALSEAALHRGGLYALVTCLFFIGLSLVIARRLPTTREIL